MDLVNEWLDWMRTVHIPAVMATGCFISYRLTRILSDEDEPDGKTFAIQYTSPSPETFDRYLRDHASALQLEHRRKFSNRFVAIRTLMQVIEEQLVYVSPS